ncbi:MAG: flagellar hook-associated protein FlgL [Verrucomicrobiota bacterium]
MRVTSNSFSSDLINQLGSLSSRQTRLQNQAASGQSMRTLEENPVAMGRVVNWQSEANAVAQYQRNIDSQKRVAEATYGAIQSLKRISDRAGEIAVLADGLKSPEEMASYAAEVTQLLKQAVQLGNTKNNGNYLFAGTQSDQPPFTATENADGTVASVSYGGNTEVSEVEMAEGVTLAAQTVGSNSSGSGPRGLIADSRAGADLFNHLISLQNHLVANDSAAVAASDRPQLEQDEENLLFHVASNASIQGRLEASAAMAEVRSSSLEKSVSSEADADLAETLVRLGQTQTAYQAALQTGAKILNLSLLDYLR